MGCDWRLDSNSVEDHCGICNGDGSGCRLVNETYIDSGQGNFKVFFYNSWVDSFGVKWINIQLLVRLLTLLIICSKIEISRRHATTMQNMLIERLDRATVFVFFIY